MTSEKYGFTGKVTEHKAGLYLRIPDLVVESADIKDEDLLHLTLRNMQGQEVRESRKARKSSGQVKVYLPKNIRTTLGLQHKDLVDVFFQKD